MNLPRRARLVAAVIAAVVAVSAVWLSGCGGRRSAQFYSEGSSRSPQQDIPRAVAKVAPAVVRIDTTLGGGPTGLFGGMFGPNPADIFPRRGEASGIVIQRRNGYVLTNAHVARGARSITVTLPDGRSFKGKALGSDPVTDIAVVKIEGSRLPEAQLGSSDRLRVGSRVIAVGNPYGLDNTVTAGVLSAKGRIIVGEGGLAVTDLLQTDAAINSGNSGGALVDLQGQVVGMPTAVVRSAQGIGFAVAIDTAKYIVPQLVRNGKAVHAWMGVSYGTPAKGGGALIHTVQPGAPAARAGLQPGDLMVAIQGRKIRQTEDLASAIRSFQPGDEVKITFLRQGKRRTVTVRLAEMPQQR
jgi:serine protease Do